MDEVFLLFQGEDPAVDDLLPLCACFCCGAELEQAPDVGQTVKTVAALAEADDTHTPGVGEPAERVAGHVVLLADLVGCNVWLAIIVLCWPMCLFVSLLLCFWPFCEICEMFVFN